MPVQFTKFSHHNADVVAALIERLDEPTPAKPWAFATSRISPVGLPRKTVSIAKNENGSAACAHDRAAKSRANAADFFITGQRYSPPSPRPAPKHPNHPTDPLGSP